MNDFGRLNHFYHSFFEKQILNSEFETIFRFSEKKKERRK